MGEVTIIGLDWATQESKRGVAVARLDGGAVRDVRVVRCGRQAAALTGALEVIENSAAPVLLAIDAPLGWPAALGDSLREHRAGNAIAVPPHEMFSQATDRFVFRFGLFSTTVQRSTGGFSESGLRSSV
jgi:hypothetical protein